MKLFLVAILVILGAVSFSCASAEEFKCDPNARYKENNCNGCTCTEGSEYFACTDMECPSEETRKMEKCEVGTSYQKDCNKCWCLKNIGTLCTTKQC